jgi:DNA-3-methyladenine glycosylase I
MISFSSANHQIVTSSQLKRCTWCENTFDDYVTYHDVEWGVPVHDDTKHFEFLILEGAQAGLSWATILKKRAGYREAFSNFDVEAVAAYNENTIGYLLAFPGIIKNKLKINGAVNNAKKFIEVQKEWGSFDQYIWSFVGEKPIISKGGLNSWEASPCTPTCRPAD